MPREWVPRPALDRVLHDQARRAGDKAMFFVLHPGDGVPGGTGKVSVVSVCGLHALTASHRAAQSFLAQKLAADMYEEFGFSAAYAKLDLNGTKGTDNDNVRSETVAELKSRALGELGAGSERPAKAAAAYDRFFSMQTTRGVLVLDDVGKEQLQDGALKALVLPALRKQWCVIVTTRLVIEARDWQDVWETPLLQAVGTWSAGEGADVLRNYAFSGRRTPAEDAQLAEAEDAAFEKLAAECGGVALALRCVGLRVGQKLDRTVEEIANEIDVLKSSDPRVSSGGERSCLRRTLLLTLKEWPAKDRQAAFLAACFPQSFTSVLFKFSWKEMRDGADAASEDSESESEGEALYDVLQRNGLVTMDDNSLKYSMHDIVKEVLVRQMRKEKVDKSRCIRAIGVGCAKYLGEYIDRKKKSNDACEQLARVIGIVEWALELHDEAVDAQFAAVLPSIRDVLEWKIDTQKRLCLFQRQLRRNEQTPFGDGAVKWRLEIGRLYVDLIFDDRKVDENKSKMLHFLETLVNKSAASV